MLVRHLSRSLLVLALVVSAQTALAGSANALPPVRDDDGAAGAQAKPGGGSGSGGGGGTGSTARGYDISYPQCGGAYPANPAFAIVGINDGRVFGANPCLANQIAWGGGANAELYANTGNPGPALSSFWPAGQTVPRFCDPANPDTADCAFDYGYNAAKHSFETAVAAYSSLALSASPAATRWWLDVETMNSWRSDVALNVAALQGEVAYLRDVAGVTKLGFYSTTHQWGTITGGTKLFATSPSWGAGASSERAASNLCTTTKTSFTGGPLTMVQFIISGFDADIRC